MVILSTCICEFNPLTTKLSPKMPLLTVKSFVFGCHNAKWALILLKKLFFTKRGQKFALAAVKTWLDVGYGQGLEMAP